MPRGKKSRVLRVALMAFGLATATHAAEADPPCPGGPALVRELLQLNENIWRSGANCDWHPITEAAGDSAISQFERVALENGLAAGLRTFARTGDFQLFGAEASPMALAAADRYLDRQDVVGVWTDTARGGSADSSLLYAAGEVLLSKGRSYQYAQVWQYDPRTANWGVRLLMIRLVAKK
jgi:hypothetical protein